MSVRQYVGARYVPKFYDHNNGVWESNTEYEPLTIVQYNSNSYTSKKTVPANIGNPSKNPDYWVVTGNYNAQVEGYSREVAELSDDIVEFKSNVNTKLDGVDNRIDGVDTRIDGVDNRIDGVNNRIDGVNTRIDNLNLSEIVVFGDSFAYGFLTYNTSANPTLSQSIANILKLNLHNYSVNGAAYTSTDNSIIGQVNYAISDNTYNHDLVKYVLVIGGMNDAYVLPGRPNCSTQSLLVQRTISQHYKNAKTFIIPNWGSRNLGLDVEQVFKSICVSDNNLKNVTYLYDNLKCLIGYPSLMMSDDIHPNQNGYNTMAQYIAARINGGYLPRGKMLGITAKTGWDTNSLFATRTEDSVWVHGIIKATQTITDATHDICTIDSASASSNSHIFVECTSTNFNNYSIFFNVGQCAANDNRPTTLTLFGDREHTISPGTDISVNFELPILNL